MKAPANTQQHHKQRLRHFGERCRRQKQLAEEFVINLPYDGRPKRENRYSVHEHFEKYLAYKKSITTKLASLFIIQITAKVL